MGHVPNYSVCSCANGASFHFIVFVAIPFWVWFFLSIMCALYVVKALLNQIKRDKKVSNTYILTNFLCMKSEEKIQF